MTSWNYPQGSFDVRGANALDAARTAFEWLVTGSQPVSVDGRMFPGLPNRRVPLDELRDRLLDRRCRQSVKDAVWAHLVLRSRTEGASWTVGCVGVALPALTSAAATLSARFAGDAGDIHAALVTGFLAALPTVDLRGQGVMSRLRWAAYRAGMAAVREALDAPGPVGHVFRSAAPPPPWGHPDFVLARAVAEAAITSDEAELIGVTRLEGRELKAAADDRRSTYKATHAYRMRAERRLVAWLREQHTRDQDPQEAAVDNAAVTAAGHRPTRASQSPAVTVLRRQAGEKPQDRVLKTGAKSGVQECGTASPDACQPSTQEVPRCA